MMGIFHGYVSLPECNIPTLLSFYGDVRPWMNFFPLLSFEAVVILTDPL